MLARTSRLVVKQHNGCPSLPVLKSHMQDFDSASRPSSRNTCNAVSSACRMSLFRRCSSNRSYKGSSQLSADLTTQLAMVCRESSTPKRDHCCSCGRGATLQYLLFMTYARQTEKRGFPVLPAKRVAVTTGCWFFTLAPRHE